MANYMKIAISGKEVGLSFGSYTNQLITESENIPFAKLFETSLVKIMYYAYLANCERNSTTPEFKLFDFFDLLDEIGGESEPFLMAQKNFIVSIQGLVKGDKKADAEVESVVKEIEGKLKALTKAQGK